MSVLRVGWGVGADGDVVWHRTSVDFRVRLWFYHTDFAGLGFTSSQPYDDHCVSRSSPCGITVAEVEWVGCLCGEGVRGVRYLWQGCDQCKLMTLRQAFPIWRFAQYGDLQWYCSFSAFAAGGGLPLRLRTVSLMKRISSGMADI